VIDVYSTATKLRINAAETEIEAEAGTETESRQGTVGIGRSECVRLDMTRATVPRAPSLSWRLVCNVPALPVHNCLALACPPPDVSCANAPMALVSIYNEFFKLYACVERNRESYQRTRLKELSPLRSSPATQHLTPACCTTARGQGAGCIIVTSLTQVLPAARSLYTHKNENPLSAAPTSLSRDS